MRRNKESKSLVNRADIQRGIKAISGRLLAEGLTFSTYTKAKAKAKTKDAAAPVYVRGMIDAFSPEIKSEMKAMRKRNPKKK